jgi:hypothetical protein
MHHSVRVPGMKLWLSLHKWLHFKYTRFWLLKNQLTNDYTNRLLTYSSDKSVACNNTIVPGDNCVFRICNYVFVVQQGMN